MALERSLIIIFTICILDNLPLIHPRLETKDAVLETSFQVTNIRLAFNSSGDINSRVRRRRKATLLSPQPKRFVWSRNDAIWHPLWLKLGRYLIAFDPSKHFSCSPLFIFYLLRVQN